MTHILLDISFDIAFVLKIYHGQKMWPAPTVPTEIGGSAKVVAATCRVGGRLLAGPPSMKAAPAAATATAVPPSVPAPA